MRSRSRGLASLAFRLNQFTERMLHYPLPRRLAAHFTQATQSKYREEFPQLWAIAPKLFLLELHGAKIWKHRRLPVQCLVILSSVAILSLANARVHGASWIPYACPRVGQTSGVELHYQRFVWRRAQMLRHTNRQARITPKLVASHVYVNVPCGCRKREPRARRFNAN